MNSQSGSGGPFQKRFLTLPFLLLFIRPDASEIGAILHILHILLRLFIVVVLLFILFSLSLFSFCLCHFQHVLRRNSRIRSRLSTECSLFRRQKVTHTHTHTQPSRKNLLWWIFRCGGGAVLDHFLKPKPTNCKSGRRSRAVYRHLISYDTKQTKTETAAAAATTTTTTTTATTSANRSGYRQTLNMDAVCNFYNWKSRWPNNLHFPIGSFTKYGSTSMAETSEKKLAAPVHNS